jgi:beta-galactosidase/beta-glucuronidase
VDRRIEIGTRDGIGVPHRYTLDEGLTPGTHTIFIRVDNRMVVPIGQDAHAVSDQTQSNWNGIVGDLRLEAVDRAWSLGPLRVDPDVESRSIAVTSRVGDAGPPDRGRVEFEVVDRDGTVEARSSVRLRDAGRAGPDGGFSHEIALPERVRLWDEFDPAVYTLRARVIDEAGRERDAVETTFGVREIAADGTRFLVNGEPTMMRGALDCAIFPDTGSPPTDVDAWLEIFGTVKDFGLNHIRFHSWCPPRAAFVAADRLGVYLQPEISTWPSLDDGNGLEDWLARRRATGCSASTATTRRSRSCASATRCGATGRGS